MRYWDYPSSTSPYWSTTTTNATPTTPYYGNHDRFYSPTTASSTGSTIYGSGSYYVTYVVKHYLVSTPDHWTKEDVADFVYLINDATNTGFKVMMVINGDDIDITDPDVERRTMADFVPLLLSKANRDDQKAIRTFFDAHPTDTPVGDMSGE